MKHEPQVHSSETGDCPLGIKQSGSQSASLITEYFFSSEAAQGKKPVFLLYPGATQKEKRKKNKMDFNTLCFNTFSLL